MPPIKMQSYAAIKHEALTTFEVDCLLAELQRRDLLCYEFVGEGLEQHLMWKGSMDSGNPAHPRSTSVKVCGWIYLRVGQDTALEVGGPVGAAS